LLRPLKKSPRRNSRLGQEIDQRLLLLLAEQTRSTLWPTTAVGLFVLLLAPFLEGGGWIVAIMLGRAAMLAQNCLIADRVKLELGAGVANAASERKLVWGLAISCFLSGLLTLPLKVGETLDFQTFLIVTVALFSVCLLVISASFHRSAMLAAAIGGGLGLAPKIGLLTLQIGVLLPIGFVIYLATVFAYGSTLMHQARGGTLLQLRRQDIAKHRSKTNEALQQLLDQTQRLADRDALTDLRNRRAFERDLETFRTQYAHRRCVLMLIDIDHFKAINDRFGHTTGDGVLLAVGTTLRQWEEFSSGRMVGRWGGEEFIAAVALRPEERLRDQAEALREGIAILSEQLHWPDTVTLTVSIGCADLSASPSIGEALSAADRALYAAKDAGRNRCRLAA
jgi:diguanylate cyclase (GGDEF)-like protein